MDNKATTKRMIGAVVLVLVAALLLAWLLKGKNREGQQDMAMNQTGEVKPILGFAGVGDEAQKPSIVGDDPNAAAQQAAGAGQAAGIDVTQQQQGAGATQQAGANVIPGVDVKLPETVPNTTGFDVRPAGEVRDLVDTDNKVKDGIGSMGTGNAKAVDAKTGTAAPAPAAQDAAGKAQQPAVAPAPSEHKVSTAPSASQQDKAPTNNDAAPTEKKASSKVVLVNEKPVPKATSDVSMRAAAERAAATKQAAEDKAVAIKKEVTEKAAAAAKVAAEKAAAAKSVALANAKPGTAATTGAAASGFSIQVLASADKAKAEAAAAPLKADGYNVAVSTATVGGKPVYRVNVGGFADRADAEAAQVKMKARYKQNDAIQGSFVTGSK